MKKEFDVKEDDFKNRLLNLNSSIKQLLCELGIDMRGLEIMANGYSPNDPDVNKLDLKYHCWDNGESSIITSPKIQLSQKVAENLLNSLVKMKKIDVTNKSEKEIENLIEEAKKEFKS